MQTTCMHLSSKTVNAGGGRGHDPLRLNSGHISARRFVDGTGAAGRIGDTIVGTGDTARGTGTGDTDGNTYTSCRRPERPLSNKYCFGNPCYSCELGFRLAYHCGKECLDRSYVGKSQIFCLGHSHGTPRPAAVPSWVAAATLCAAVVVWRSVASINETVIMSKANSFSHNGGVHGKS
jgi:hypothetical protein